MRTIANVDGYNLFFRGLKNTAYKWLDLVALIESILRTQDPSLQLGRHARSTRPTSSAASRSGGWKRKKPTSISRFSKVEGGSRQRPPNLGLSKLAHWTRHEIKNAELAACQLPTRVPTNKKPIDKQDYW